MKKDVIPAPVETNEISSENYVSIKVTNDYSIKVNIFPEIEQKLSLVKTIVSGAFIDEMVYQCLVNSRFLVLFLVTFTDYLFDESLKNDAGLIDAETGYNYCRMFNWEDIFLQDQNVYNLYMELKDDIQAQIELEKEKLLALHARNVALEDTLENLNSLINMGKDFLNSISTSFTPEAMGEPLKEVAAQFIEATKSVADKRNAV